MGTFILPDVLEFNLDIVFCGTAAGDKSAARKAYYAGHGNLFYLTLATCGYTPKLLQPHEYMNLLDHKIGLTDLAKFTHGMDRNLTESDYDTGSFSQKILKYKPKVVCFNGKEAASVYLKMKTKQIAYGLQVQSIGKTKLFVAPSTSFSGRKYWDENIWRELKAHLIT